MKILILGGTGAMGVPLVNILSGDVNNYIFVSSRSKRINEKNSNVQYLTGDAKNPSFFSELMNDSFDVIIDFMSYTTDDFHNRFEMLLNKTGQYFFISSARCFAESKDKITEESERLIEVCKDEEYLATDEYALAKGREENILFNSGKNNYTIIRPYITYNSYRFQLGVYEKETWLKRALENKTILFPSDMARKYTTLTSGVDVAYLMSQLVGNDNAKGQVFNIVTDESYTWEDILQQYIYIINEIVGFKPKVEYIDNSIELSRFKGSKYQILYDRLFDRKFDNNKIKRYCGDYKFKNTFDGLRDDLIEFCKNPQWRQVNGRFEGWYDRKTRSYTKLSEIGGVRNKLAYIKTRTIGI